MRVLGIARSLVRGPVAYASRAVEIAINMILVTKSEHAQSFHALSVFHNVQKWQL